MTPTFGQQLHTTRTALGMTQDDMAVLVGVDKQTISNWECERTRPWPNKAVEVLTRLLGAQRGQPRCHLCSRVLDNPADPLSENCGGDCLKCMADAGDPECITAIEQLKLPAPVRARVIDRI